MKKAGSLLLGVFLQEHGELEVTADPYGGGKGEQQQQPADLHAAVDPAGPGGQKACNPGGVICWNDDRW